MRTRFNKLRTTCSYKHQKIRKQNKLKFLIYIHTSVMHPHVCLQVEYSWTTLEGVFAGWQCGVTLCNIVCNVLV